MKKTRKTEKFIYSPFGRILMIAILYVIIFLILSIPGQFTYLMGGNEALDYFLWGWAFFLAIFGWKALTKIQPTMFLFLSWVGWIFYFLVKGLLSMICGYFVAPFIIAKWIVNLIQKTPANQEDENN